MVYVPHAALKFVHCGRYEEDYAAHWSRRNAMKAVIRDLDVLKAIEPPQVATYLQANGWNQESMIADKASIWIQKTDAGEEFDILLPLKSEFTDFPILISQVIENLESAEDRSQLEIISDIIN